MGFAKKPLLWAEIFGGGFGGLIARHRPLLEPDPASMRRMIENWCAERGMPIERPPIDYGGGPGAQLIADDADVTVIASHAARMGIDMLIPRNPSIFPNSVCMIGLAEGWIFKAPFETYPIDVGPPIIQESGVAVTHGKPLRNWREFYNYLQSTKLSLCCRLNPAKIRSLAFRYWRAMNSRAWSLSDRARPPIVWCCASDEQE